MEYKENIAIARFNRMSGLSSVAAEIKQKDVILSRSVKLRRFAQTNDSWSLFFDNSQIFFFETA